MTKVRNTSEVDIEDWSGRVSIPRGEEVEVSDSDARNLHRSYSFIEVIVEEKKKEESSEEVAMDPRVAANMEAFQGDAETPAKQPEEGEVSRNKAGAALATEEKEAATRESKRVSRRK